MCCPMCEGPAGLLGRLGNLDHFQCRDCGWTWSDLADPPEPSLADSDELGSPPSDRWPVAAD